MRLYKCAALCAIIGLVRFASACRDEAERPDSGLPDVTVSGTLVDPATQKPIDKLAVCVHRNGAKSGTCTTTDATGVFSIQIAPETETGLWAEKAGYGPTFWPLWTEPSTAGRSLGQWAVATVPEVAAQHAKVGLTPSTARGMLVVNAAPDSSLVLAPAAGKGPYYPGADNLLDPAQTKMGAGTGDTTRAWGAVLDLAAGAYEVTVSHGSKKCARSLTGWPSKTGSTVRIPVFAGFGSPVLLDCQ